MSPLVQESAPYNHPIQALFDLHMAPFIIQPHAAPFKPHAAPFKWQPVVIEKPAMHQNDQQDELSHMGSRSALYDYPVQVTFEPHSAPFTIQPCVAPFIPCVAPFILQPVVREKQDRYQNDQHNEPSHMGPRSAPYNSPIWAPFDPCSAPFTIQPCAAPFKPCTAPFTIQPHAGAPFREDDF